MHKQIALPYGYDALEPYIDTQTMEIHYTKHHAAYVANLNAALEKAGPALKEFDIERVLVNLNEVPEELRTAVRNNGGGHYNHNLFWTVMGPRQGGDPKGRLAEAIDKHFGSFKAFKEQFENAAKTRFGSGWAWLYVANRELYVGSTPNQDNPIIERSGIPILGLDVWEHAYYLKYQNRRPEYVRNFWELVNWDEVGRRFDETGTR